MNSNINMGYFDALRVMKGYIGEKFYVIPSKSDNKVFNMIFNVKNDYYLEKIYSVNKDILTLELNKSL